MLRRLVLSLLSLTLLAAACSDDGPQTAEVEPPTTTVADEGEIDEATTTTAAAAVLPDYSQAIADLPEAPDDRSLPPVTPDNPLGSYGFSRYVYQQQGSEIVPTLVEGPQGFQTRCQQLDQSCSYLELQEIYDSGDEIPSYLRMDRETLGELLDQLGRVEAAVGQYETLDDACAAGLQVSSSQNANMGIHVINPTAGPDFDPDDPQMILFAKDGGERIPRPDIGSCVDGEFTGEDGFQAVGAVFNIEFTEDHPEGFAGDLDNWHVHYNTCAGGTVENASQVDPEVDVEATGVTQAQCEEGGGFFLPVISSWMMHAYVVPEFDPQGGIFSMFNPSVWPVIDTDEIRDDRTITNDDAIAAPITNFDFGNIEVDAGQTVRFANSDSVPHTVTAGTSLDPDIDEFDSGLLGTAQTYDVDFDSVGEFQLFCVLHPEMTATVTVN